VQERILQLIDSRPKQPGTIPGSELAPLYKQRFGLDLNPVELTGQTELKAMLNRRNIFPSIGVRGSAKKSGHVHVADWLVYKVLLPKVDTGTAASALASSPLLQVQDNILELLRRAANPEDSSPPHHSVEAGSLPNRYGFVFKKRFNFRDYGFASLRELIARCPKLACVMRGAKGDQMHVVARCECCPDGLHLASKLGRATLVGKRPREEKMSAAGPLPAAGASNALLVAVAPSRTATTAASMITGDDPATSGMPHSDAVESDAAKKARKAAKRAAKAAARGMSVDEAEEAAAEAKRRRIEKKAAGKLKKQAWLKAHGKA